MSVQVSPYDSLFYEYQRDGALRSAQLVLPMLHEALRIESVLDVGCGAAAWLRAHRDLGATDVLGLDGDYVDRSLLLIEPERFQPRDITKPFDLGRAFDLVQCLEVAEHIPEATSGVLVDNLVRHGRVILFSAAVPGQGGKDHINEKPISFWRRKFRDRGYRAYDFIRPSLHREPGVDWWYRYNTILYVHEDLTGALPASIRVTELPAGPIPDYSPLGMRVRKLALRMLPVPIVSMIAVVKHRQYVRSLRFR